MPALNFPSSPTVGQTYSSGGKTWQWNGVSWVFKTVSLQASDITSTLGYTPVSESGSYANPAWLTSLGWSKITGTPTTLSGYGITNAYTKTEVDGLISGVGYATSDRRVYTATAGQTTFAATYAVGFVDVYLNGSKLQTGVEFTATNGTSIVLAAGAAVGDVVDIVAYNVFSVANTYTQAQTDSLLSAKQATLVSGTNIKTINGGSVLGSGDLSIGGGVSFIRRTGNYTAVDKDGIIADTTAAPFTVNLPASPTSGTQVHIVDGSNWSVNNLTIGRNGATIEGVAEDLIIDIGGIYVSLVYDGTTWQVYTQVSAVNGSAVSTSAIQTLTNKTIAFASNTLTGVPGLAASNTFTGANSYTGTQTFSGSPGVVAAVFSDVAETVTISATAATGTINYDITTQSVLYYTTNSSANWTVNFRASSGTTLNAAMTTGQSMTVVFIATNGVSAFYNNVVQVDGTVNGVTTRWLGSSPSAGNASSLDVYTYTIIKTGNTTWTVLASQAKFA